MANIVITGGSGFIGQQLAIRALKSGHKVGILDIKKPGLDNIVYSNCDITVKESVVEGLGKANSELGNIDALVHLAASFNYTKPDHYQHMYNVRGTDNIAEVASNILTDNKLFIYMGAIASCRENFHNVIKEDTPLHPFENYGKSKQLAEELLFEKYYSTGKLQVTTFRAVMVYGNFATGSYIDGLFNMIKNSPIILAPLKDTKNSYVHTDDIARAFLHSINNHEKVFVQNANHPNDLAYNLADDLVVSERNVIKILKNLIPGAKHKPVLPIVPQKLFEILSLTTEKFEKLVKERTSLSLAIAKHAAYNHVLDNTKFKNTGFEYKVPNVKVGLPMVVEWYKNNVWQKDH